MHRASFIVALVLGLNAFDASPAPVDTPALVAALQAAAPEVAAPWFIIVHGKPLSEQVVLPDWHENHMLLLSRRPATRAERTNLTERASLNLALFWGPEWKDYPRTPESLARLRPEQGNQHGRFYPAHGLRPPLMTGVPASAHVVEDAGLEVLARHGIPVRID